VQTDSTFEVDHGRRNHGVTGDVSWLVNAHPAWNTIKSIGVVESIRTIGETVTTEQRYYVSSLPPDPVLFGSSVRALWGIENSLHYVRDVAFGEDACRIKSGNAPENMAFIRKIALSLARSDTESTRSMASRIKQMAWSEEYLEHLLFRSGFTGQTEPSVTVP
ncbi:MAG: ISAs1 family transposase, partial [Spirochaetaceae bacterium]|jgi:predicted transposase YbfD/YdcC|nr:ISAs1 family transposase [Spirochaetaceae bacterium]